MCYTAELNRLASTRYLPRTCVRLVLQMDKLEIKNYHLGLLRFAFSWVESFSSRL